MRSWINLVGAEVRKQLSYPASLIVISASIFGAAIFAVVVTKNLHVADSINVAAITIPIVQVGLIIVGILSASQEYASKQIHTSLLAIPNRLQLASSKVIGLFLVGGITAITTVSVLYGTTWLLAGQTDFSANTLPYIGGAILYLLIICLFSYGISLLVRSLTTALVATLAIILLLPPLLASVSKYVQWLPAEIGHALYAVTNSEISIQTSILVLVAWALVSVVVGSWRLISTDG